MNKVSKITAILLITVLAGCSSTLESRWHTGELADKTGFSSIEGYQYNSDAGMMYLVSNTNDSLFLDIKFPNELTATKILRFGLVVWLDPAAKKNKAYGVRFPLGQKRGLETSGGRLPQPEVIEGEDGFQRLRYPDRKGKGQKSQLLRENMELSLFGFKEYEGALPLPTSKSPFPVRLYYDRDNLLSYHLALPLEAIHSSSFQKGDAISLGIIAGRLKAPDRSDKMHGREPMGGGRRGGGMMPGGTMGGGRQMGQQRYPDMAQPTAVWIKKVYLSSENTAAKPE